MVDCGGTGIFGNDVITHGSGMREIILCQGHGANDGSDGTVTGRFTRTRPTVLARFAVCFKRIDEGGIKGWL